MKRQSMMVLTTLSLLVMLAASSVYGQSGMRFSVNIPFEFSVGKKILPAGEYTVRYASQGVLVIQSADRRVSRVAMTISTQANKPRDNSSLIFNQYGDRYFLSKVWTAGDSIGQELRTSLAELELIRGMRVAAKGTWEQKPVSIVAHR